jgi:ligand-binding sensor domain-containing protein/serine phosphatase RsbU (regulator of sigma subunit)
MMAFRFLLLCLIFWAQNIYAQLYSIKSYTQEDGLYGVFFYKIFQDSKGFIWLGSSKGLSRYDGSRFEYFLGDDFLTNSIIYEIYEDKKGHIWIGTFDGLVRFDGKNWLKILGVRNVRQIIEDKEGRLYFFYASHVIRYDYKKFEVFSHDLNLVISATMISEELFLVSSDINEKRLVSLSFVNKNPSFIIPKDSIQYYKDYEDKFFNNLSKKQQREKELSVSQNFNFDETTVVKKIFRNPNGKIWLGTESGIFILGDSGKLEPFFQDKIKTVIRDISQDKKGNILFATTNGLFIWDKLDLEHIEKRNGLFSNNISTCFVDNQDNIWFGMTTNLVQKLQLRKFIGFSAVSQDFEGNFIPNSVALDRFGIFNFVTDKGLYRFDGERMVWFEDSFTKYLYCFIDKKDRLWIRNEKGFKLIQLTSDLNKKPSYQILDASNGLPRQLQNLVDYPERYYVTIDGEVIIGSYFGVFRFYNQKWSDQKPINCSAVASIAEDKKGNLWIGTWCGINRFDRERGAVYQISDFQDSSNKSKVIKAASCVEILPDKDGGIWINTFNQGLIYMSDTTHYKIFLKEDGLRNLDLEYLYTSNENEIYAGNAAGIDYLKGSTFLPFGSEIKQFLESTSLAYSNQNLWIGCKNGLYRYDGIKFHSYSKSDGLIDNSIRKVIELKDNILTIHESGFSIYKPENDLETFQPSPLYITSISIDNKKIDISDTIFVSNPRVQLKINFSLLSYKDENKNLYSYKLEGVDKNWSEFSSLNFAQYNILAAGIHRFNVKAINNIGQKNSCEKTIVVVVNPFYYQTTWFYLLILALLTGLFLLIYKIRIAQIKKQKQELENIISQRTEEITQKNIALSQTNELILNQKNELEQITQELKSTNEDLFLAYNEIKSKSQSIVSSINYAFRIQNAILPKEAELKTSYPYFVFYQPKDVVSGDFYWYADKGDKKIYVVGDCTGHGVPGAFMTIIANNILNQIVHEKEIHEPEEILNRIPMLLGKTFAGSQQNIKDGMDLAILCIYEKDGLPYEFAFSGALSSLYYVQDKLLFEIKGDRMSIGEGFNRNKTNRYKQTKMSLDRKTIFYLGTDGFHDQFGGDNFNKFTRKNFMNFLLEIHNLTLEEQNQTLRRAFQTWKGNRAQTDDVLVFGILIEKYAKK